METLTTTAFVFCIVSAVGVTVYQVYWDLVVDWGLLRPRAHNPWLRDTLLVDQKWVYWAAMVSRSGNAFSLPSARPIECG